jgi:hypothetical protein
MMGLYEEIERIAHHEGEVRDQRLEVRSAGGERET